MSAGGVEQSVRVVPGPCAKWGNDGPVIRETLGRVGDKWSVLVIATLQARPMRYTDLQHSIPGISQRMLTLTLRHLLRDGLLTRTAYAEVPPRVEYALTPLGFTLRDVVLAMAGWVVTHVKTIQDNRARFDADET